MFRVTKLQCGVLQLPKWVSHLSNTAAECHVTMALCNMATLDAIAAMQIAAYSTDLRD